MPNYFRKSRSIKFNSESPSHIKLPSQKFGQLNIVLETTFRAKKTFLQFFNYLTASFRCKYVVYIQLRMTFRTLGTKIFRQVFNQLWLLENSSALSMLEDSFLTIKCYNLIGKIPTITNLYISFLLVSNAKYKTLFDCIF